MLNLFKKKPKGQEITLAIKGMHCASCAMNIDGALEDIKGVIKSTTSYAKAQIDLEYDPALVTKEELIKVVENEGYSIS